MSAEAAGEVDRQHERGGGKRTENWAVGAHLVGAEVVQVGGKARLRLEACGGKGRCGQTGCTGAEGTREILERQLGDCLGVAVPGRG